MSRTGEVQLSAISAWALTELRAFIRVTDHVPHRNTPGSGVFVAGTFQRGTDTEAAERAHVAEQILDRVLPRWRNEDLGSGPGKPRRWTNLRQWASRAIAALEREAELREKLGDGSPPMSVGALHPWVWDPAKQLWAGGHYRAAVHAAATSVVTQAQAKSGRFDVSDKRLSQEVLGLGAPAPDRPRLRVAPDDGSQTHRSAQEGAMHLAIGLSQGVRNVVAHSGDELDEQTGLEQLAALSLLARWIDSAQVEAE